MSKGELTQAQVDEIDTIGYAFQNDLTNDERIAIRIIEGEFNGLIYAYKNIQIEDDENDPRITFEYDILSFPTENTTLVEQLKTEDGGTDVIKFNTIICKIMNDIMVNMTESMKETHEEKFLESE